MLPIRLRLFPILTAAMPVTDSGGLQNVSVVLPAQARCEGAGPYPTIGSANRIAAKARRRGHDIVVHVGDGYYVRAC